MRITHVLLAVAATAAMNAAYADGANYDYPGEQGFVSSKSRAEVTAELVEARKKGLVNLRDDEYPAVPPQGTPRTREEVRVELIESRKNSGQADSIYFGA